MSEDNPRNITENSRFLTGKSLEVRPGREYDQKGSIRAMYHKSVTEIHKVPLKDGTVKTVKVRFVLHFHYWSVFRYSPYFWNKSVRGSALKERKRFVWYDVFVDGSKEPVGAVSSYITDERIDSLLYRYFNRSTWDSLTIEGTVRAHNPVSVKIDGTVRTNDKVGKQPYIHIPESVVSELDLHVDDLVDIHVTNRDGITATRRYHISKANKTAILPLSKFRKLGVVSDPLTKAPVVKSVPKCGRSEDGDTDPCSFEGGIIAQIEGEPMTMVYRIPKRIASANGIDHEHILEYTRFIEIGDGVKVTVTPVLDASRFFLNRETLLKIASVRRVDRRVYASDLAKAKERGYNNVMDIRKAWLDDDPLPESITDAMPDSEDGQGWIETPDGDE